MTRRGEVVWEGQATGRTGNQDGIGVGRLVHMRLCHLGPADPANQEAPVGKSNYRSFLFMEYSVLVT
jgi:hypothetical protein